MTVGSEAAPGFLTRPQLLALFEFAALCRRVVRLRTALRASLAGPAPRMRAAARRLAEAEEQAAAVRRLIPAPRPGGRAMSDEEKPAPTPEQREAARRLLELRREIRRELERHRHDLARVRAATRKRRPVLAEPDEVRATLERVRASVERLVGMRAEERRLAALLAPPVSPRRVVATVTVWTHGGGGRRNPR